MSDKLKIQQQSEERDLDLENDETWHFFSNKTQKSEHREYVPFPSSWEGP